MPRTSDFFPGDQLIAAFKRALDPIRGLVTKSFKDLDDRGELAGLEYKIDDTVHVIFRYIEIAENAVDYHDISLQVCDSCGFRLSVDLLILWQQYIQLQPKSKAWYEVLFDVFKGIILDPVITLVDLCEALGKGDWEGVLENAGWLALDVVPVGKVASMSGKQGDNIKVEIEFLVDIAWAGRAMKRFKNVARKENKLLVDPMDPKEYKEDKELLAEYELSRKKLEDLDKLYKKYGDRLTDGACVS